MRRLRLALLALALACAAPAAAQAAEAPAVEAPARSLPSEIDAGDDAAIARRLRATFAGVEALEEVRVAVSAGVVRLDGEAPTAAARDLAEALAAQVENVALVENDVRLARDLGAAFRAARARLTGRAFDLLALLPLLLVAAATIVLFWLAGRALSARDWPYRRARNAFARRLGRQATRAALVFVGVALALEIVGATALAAGLLGAAGVFGLVLGLAFRDLAENSLASLFLSLRQPFAPDDFVRIGDHEGNVVRLTARATVLLTVEGNHVRIPNADVYKGVIVNYTANPLRRFAFRAGIGLAEDLARAQAIGLAALRATPGVEATPPPQAFVVALGDFAAPVELAAWVDQSAHDFMKVRSEAIRAVKEALDAEGVAMPEPISRVILEREEAAAPPPRPRTDRPQPTAGDVARSGVIEAQADADRARGGAGLLDPRAPREL
ncbi:mechanosensitive ion channel domain-containing protein [Salinarimonas sp.]|uniref:mechanosensitive ion channel domain-containing protein n=1 Tax=Salinarimonas sp. TaxID=2766526 RepID=UPI0032D976F4